MRFKDRYKHYKGGEYLFQYICYPMSMSHCAGSLEFVITAKNANTDPLEDVRIYHKDGVYFADCKDYVVLYKRISDQSVWVREVDDFFGYKEHEDERMEKRFVLQR